MEISSKGISIELFVAFSWTGINGTDLIGDNYGVYILYNHEEKFDGETGEFIQKTEAIELFHE